MLLSVTKTRGGYEIVDIDQIAWESFYVVGWDFEGQYRLVMT
jgi:hypothetical protein